MIKVLIVEDSPVTQKLLERILSADAGLEIIGIVGDGEAALNFLEQNQPDVITMDIEMPGMGGLETTRRIMGGRPIPIVVVTANYNPQEMALTFAALEAGALAVIDKPRGPGHSTYEAAAKKLVQTVKSMSEVRVVRRWTRATSPLAPAMAPAASPSAVVGLPGTAHVATAPAPSAKIHIVVIGVSTGGPPVLETILELLPADFGAPILIVQHISSGFLPGLVVWLGQRTGFPVSIAEHGETPLPGRAYLAPDDSQMGVSGGRITLRQDPPESNLRPAVSYLFRSTAREYGRAAVAILLTGMGRDGAAELKILKDQGAVTMAQDEASAVVNGMPGEAVKLNAATYVLPPERIAALLVGLVNGNPR